MWVTLCGLLAVWATGCQNPDQIQIETLQRKIQELDAENASLRERLARAIADRDAALARARALEQENANLRAQLAQRSSEPQPPAPRDWQTAGPYTWTSVGTDFLFASGSADLRAEGRAKLQEIVATIQREFPDKAIWVLGHTDTDPIRRTKDLWTDNLDLSCNRAMTVFRELQRMGLQPDRLIAGGQGEFFPRASNSDRAGKAQNRRVEIIAVPVRPATGVGVPLPGEGGGATMRPAATPAVTATPVASETPATMTPPTEDGLEPR
jgi:chemotaxis protein MotB